MSSEVSASTRAVGFWSAVLATAFSLIYVFAQLAEWAGMLGSRSGPESSSTVLGIVALLTPSLFLGSSFLVLMVAVHQAAAPERKVWSHAAVAFATTYCVLISVVYFVQLAWVAPRLAEGRTRGIEMFLFVPFDSFLYAVDILGYSFMSAATLFAARVFAGGGLNRVVRLFLTANGLLLPFLALQMYWHSLLWVASLSAVTFPGETWALAGVFWRGGGPKAAWFGCLELHIISGADPVWGGATLALCNAPVPRAGVGPEMPGQQPTRALRVEVLDPGLSANANVLCEAAAAVEVDDPDRTAAIGLDAPRKRVGDS